MNQNSKSFALINFRLDSTVFEAPKKIPKYLLFPKARSWENFCPSYIPTKSYDPLYEVCERKKMNTWHHPSHSAYQYFHVCFFSLYRFLIF